MTKKDLLLQLEKLGAPKNSVVIVHTSLKAIGAVDGGAETVLDALIEYFAESGLLCVPTHTWDTRVLDFNDVRTCIGVLPTVAAKRADGVRSLNPTHSMVVFGKGAKEFVECEKTVDSPVSPNGCYAELYKRNGYILLIGVGQEKNTFIHCVEEILKIKNRISDWYEKTKIIHLDGREEIREIKVFLEDGVPDASNFFGKFERAFRRHDCIKDGTFGAAKVQLCSANKIKEVIELIYSRNEGSELLGDFSPLDEKLYE